MVKQMMISLSPNEMDDGERFIAEKRIPEFGSYYEGKRQAGARANELHALFFLLSLHHHGASRTIEQITVVDLGCRLAEEFFTGDWWKQHQCDIEQLSRKEDNEELAWLDPLRLSLLFAALNSDSSLLKSLGAWPSDWMIAEWSAVPFPQGTEQLYFAMLNQCGFGTFQLDGSRIDDDRIKLLFDVLSSPDDSVLAAALNDSLKLFSKSLKGKKVLPYEAIAVEETIITLFWKISKDTDLLNSIHSDLQPHILTLAESQ